MSNSMTFEPQDNKFLCISPPLIGIYFLYFKKTFFFQNLVTRYSILSLFYWVDFLLSGKRINWQFTANKYMKQICWKALDIFNKIINCKYTYGRFIPEVIKFWKNNVGTTLPYE